MAAGFAGGVVCLLAFGSGLLGQVTAAGNGVAAKSPAGTASVTFQYDRPGLAVPHFRMVVREDGSGSYEAEEAGTATGVAGGGSSAPTHVDRPISISPGTVEKIFKTAREEKLFAIACASKAKHIADTGTKTLTYEGPDGRGSCVYNYTENKSVSMLTDTFLSIAQTLDEGRRLEFKKRYDRLGLDAELELLLKSNDSGRATELGTISPTLKQLAGDMDLMERVRYRAAKLLERAGEGR